jgi:hypothetical protein
MDVRYLPAAVMPIYPVDIEVTAPTKWGQFEDHNARELRALWLQRQSELPPELVRETLRLCDVSGLVWSAFHPTSAMRARGIAVVTGLSFVGMHMLETLRAPEGLPERFAVLVRQVASSDVAKLARYMPGTPLWTRGASKVDERFSPLTMLRRDGPRRN